MHLPVRLLLLALSLALVALSTASPSPAPHSATVEDPPTSRMKRALRGSEALVRRLVGGDSLSSEKETKTKRMRREVKKMEKKKRCTYVGTFFHAIDCNAPVNSTAIPYANAVPSSSSSSASSAAAGVASIPSLATAPASTVSTVPSTRGRGGRGG
ncbi:hypothetical protein JCM6882_003596 [Rhodosporidiobolus microsporus]